MRPAQNSVGICDMRGDGNQILLPQGPTGGLLGMGGNFPYPLLKTKRNGPSCPLLDVHPRVGLAQRGCSFTYAFIRHSFIHPALTGAPPNLQRALGLPQPSLNRLGAPGFYAWCVRVQEGSGDPQGCQNAWWGDQERPGSLMQEAQPVDSSPGPRLSSQS